MCLHVLGRMRVGRGLERVCPGSNFPRWPFNSRALLVCSRSQKDAVRRDRDRRRHVELWRSIRLIEGRPHTKRPHLLCGRWESEISDYLIQRQLFFGRGPDAGFLAAVRGARWSQEWQALSSRSK